MRIQINDWRDIARLHPLNTWLSRPVVRDVDMPETLADRVRWQRRLRALFNDCGCVWGGPGFLAALLGAFWLWGKAVWASPFAILLWIGTAICAALLAKLIALKVSHIRLRKNLKTLELNLKSLEIGD